MLSHAVILETEKGPGDSEPWLPRWAQPASGSIQERHLEVTESDNLLHSKPMNFNPLEPTLPLSKPGCQPHPKSCGNLGNIFSSPPVSTSRADSVPISLGPWLPLARETTWQLVSGGCHPSSPGNSSQGEGKKPWSCHCHKASPCEAWMSRSSTYFV